MGFFLVCLTIRPTIVDYRWLSREPSPTIAAAISHPGGRSCFFWWWKFWRVWSRVVVIWAKRGTFVWLIRRFWILRLFVLFILAKVNSSVTLSIFLHHPTAFEQHPKTPNLHPDHYNVLNCASLWFLKVLYRGCRWRLYSCKGHKKFKVVAFDYIITLLLLCAVPRSGDG